LERRSASLHPATTSSYVHPSLLLEHMEAPKCRRQRTSSLPSAPVPSLQRRCQTMGASPAGGRSVCGSVLVQSPFPNVITTTGDRENLPLKTPLALL
jgi:hypothetical protein